MSVITASKKRENGWGTGAAENTLESRKVKFPYISHFCMEFKNLRDDISKKTYRNHKKVKS